MVTPRKVHGSDVSHWQGALDLVKAKRAGLQFLYHKATEHETYVDPEYAGRRAAAKKAGLPFGAYHFARPNGGAADAVREAQHFMRTAKPVVGDLVPCLDLEVNAPGLEAWANAFMGEVMRLMKAAGLAGRPLHYGPNDFGSDYPFLRWVPRYNNTNTPPTVSWDIWQFSNGKYGVPNSFPGLGHVDLNTFDTGRSVKDILITKATGTDTGGTKVVKGHSGTPTANKFTKALQAEVGYREGRDNANKYAAWAGHMNNQPWCATFLEGVSDKIGLRTLIPEGQAMASCDLMFQAYQKQDRWSEYPAVGAFFFLGKSGSGSVVNGKRVDLYHVGYVYAYDADHIYTIEGNTNTDGSANGNGVYRRVRRRRDASVYCYAYPKYPEGIISADPKWRAKNPKPKPTPDPPKEPASNVKKAKLRFCHASLQFSDTAAQQKADVTKLFSRGYDVITGTEAGHGSGKLEDFLVEAAKAKGYFFSKPGRYDTWVAVKKTLVVVNPTMGSEFAIWRSSRHNPAPPGRWGDKGVVWMQWNMGPTFGKFAVGAVHNLTWKGAGDKLKVETDHTYAEVMEKWRVKMGAAECFIGGDFNRSDKTHDVFMGKAGFITAADELKRHQNTGHGPIDGIAREKSTKRVKCVRYEVLDDKEMFMNTDHWILEADYEVTAVA